MARKREATAKKADVLPAVRPESPASMARRETAGDLVLMFERLAKDPAVDVGKLERLIAMQERILKINARAEFARAFAEMQPHLPEIDERGRIVIDDELRNRYAKFADIQKAIKPVLARFGFMLSFKSRHEPGQVTVVGKLRHVAGHVETSSFTAAPDTSGKKNAIQALGSARSYGRRYTTLDLTGITSRAPEDRDDDGEAANDRAAEAPVKPAPRKSQAQQPAQKAEAKQAEVVPAPAGTAGPKPEPVGRIAEFERRGNVARVRLVNGVQAGTKDGGLADALARHHEAGNVVELTLEGTRDPAWPRVIEVAQVLHRG